VKRPRDRFNGFVFAGNIETNHKFKKSWRNNYFRGADRLFYNRFSDDEDRLI
jgi:hypothetical protein